ncbi:MAG: glycosyltransferase, partial [Actinomycetota bacterium]
VEGLRIVIDGACLGPYEMGTQVATISLVRSLAARDDVEEVRVVVHHEVPAYARETLSAPKTFVVHRSALATMPAADIAHRPYQPEPLFRVSEWRPAARRLLVGMLDLIAYQIGSYHRSPQEWLRYRASIERVLASVDGVVVNSQDVRLHMELEALPVDPSRLWVVPLGMDHLTGQEEARMPAELATRGFAHQEFVLTLGANYSHKNRDLAIRAHRELRKNRPDLALVLAGPRVPHGSSRLNESEYRSAEGVFDLPGLTSEERNWLFRHASVALYPTSAEGFGLVPVEVARFGTAIVYVGFGSLREISGDPPVAAVDWDPRSLAAAVEALLGDPELARAQVAATLAAGEKYTWAQTAADLVAVYREVLARPAAGGNYDGAQAEGRTDE